MPNDHKICFIRCVNDDLYAAEQDYYLSKLIVPDGFEIDVLTITDASSMCAGYNEGMAASDAKYKIYLHQDLFIYKQDFLLLLLDAFKDKSIGMIGLVGNPELSGDAIPWHSVRAGQIFTGAGDQVVPFGKPFPISGKCVDVQAIDGVLMATQVDIPWREDLFKGWDMYDLSQSFEMKRAGYKVCVIRQDGYWALHDESIFNLQNYYGWLDVFRKEYEKDLVDTPLPKHSFTDPTVLCVVPVGGNTDFTVCLAEAGYFVHTEERRLHPNEEDARKDALYLEYCYKDSNIKAAVSQLFIPSLARFCKDRGISCISWIYDSPQQALFRPEALYDTNHFFVFDRALCKRLQDAGLPNVSYKPLCANVSRADRVISGISAGDRLRCGCDISFVGNLYKENAYLEDYDSLTGKAGSVLKKYYEANLCHWENVRPWPKMPEELCDIEDKLSDHGTMPTDLFLGTAVMSRKLAQLERITVLNMLARSHKIDLYTKSDTSDLKGVSCHPSVDYYSDAPKIFNLSKINLNITLPSIETGVPQRVFDIMAAGGFVLTNHQQEMEELFETGEEIVTFKNIDELVEKTAYYLSHEEERRRIAENGRRRIAKDYNMKTVIGQILRYFMP